MKYKLFFGALLGITFTSQAAITLEELSYGLSEEGATANALAALKRKANGNTLSQVYTSCESISYPVPFRCTAQGTVDSLSYGSNSYDMCGRTHSKSDWKARFEESVSRQMCSNRNYSKYLSNFAVNRDSFAGQECDYTSPLGRLTNAMWLLDNANKSGDNSILGWSYNSTQNDIHNTHSTCDESLYAKFTWKKRFYSWKWVKRSEMAFSRAGLYDQDVVGRTSTLVHEARHMDKAHVSASGRCSGSSCDPNWGYNGSNTYEALWLWWYAVNGNNATPAMRASAEQQANYVINNRFNSPPSYHVDKDANIINRSSASGLTRPIAR